jgi:putative DNA-invertase from lambdoid prophage Rac
VGQTTENQIQQIEAAGFKVDLRRVISEIVSGSSAIEQRPGFIKLLNKLEQDHVLIVTNLDCLGRNAIDVATTVARLGDMGVRVHCLALGGVDLTSPAGRMTMGVINSHDPARGRPPNNLEAPGMPTKNRTRGGGIDAPPA